MGRNPFFIRSIVPTFPFGADVPAKHRRNPFFIRSIVPTKNLTPHPIVVRVGRNPFFIRSIVPTLKDPTNYLVGKLGRNPFFIRSIVPTWTYYLDVQRIRRVAIPSSSGQSFQPAVGGRCFLGLQVAIPSSSGQSFQQR